MLIQYRNTAYFQGNFGRHDANFRKEVQLPSLDMLRLFLLPYEQHNSIISKQNMSIDYVQRRIEENKSFMTAPLLNL